MKNKLFAVCAALLFLLLSAPFSYAEILDVILPRINQLEQRVMEDGFPNTLDAVYEVRNSVDQLRLSFDGTVQSVGQMKSRLDELGVKYSFKLYIFDAYTKGRVTPQTKDIEVGLLVMNESSGQYPTSIEIPDVKILNSRQAVVATIPVTFKMEYIAKPFSKQFKMLTSQPVRLTRPYFVEILLAEVNPVLKTTVGIGDQARILEYPITVQELIEQDNPDKKK